MILDNESLAVAPEGLMCDCGNINFNAEEMEDESQMTCTDAEFNKLSDRISQVLVAQSSAIEISDKNKSYVTTDGNSRCFDVVCEFCNNSFRIIACKQVAYCCKMSESANVPKNAPPVSSFLPLALRPFVSIEQSSSTSNMPELGVMSMISPKYKNRLAFNDDEDSERDNQLMFKPRNDYLVGSFQHQWMY